MKKEYTIYYYILLIIFFINSYLINSLSKRVDELWDAISKRDDVILVLSEAQKSLCKNFIEVRTILVGDDTTQKERIDSVCKMLSDIQAIGDRIIEEIAVSPQAEYLSFHKMLDLLVQQPTYKCLADHYTIQSLEAASRLLAGSFEKARAKKNAVASNNFLNSYIARVAVINEFIRLQIGQMCLAQKTRMAIEDTDHVNYNIIRQCAEQGIKLNNMERSIMETLAAIPEEYDGSKYQQNLHQLKMDVDSLLSEVNRIE